MRELTRILTAQITVIDHEEREYSWSRDYKKKLEKEMKKFLKSECCADDVVVKIQDFILETKEGDHDELH